MNSLNVPKLRFPGFDGEWEPNKLEEMAQFKAGYAFKSEQMLSKKSNYQLIKMSNVYQNELRLDRNPSFWKTIDIKQKEFLLKKGDSILTLTGTVGKKDFGYSIKIEEENKFLLNQRLVLLREIQNKSDNSFISYLISNERFLFYFFAEAKGGTGNQTNVSTEDVKNIKLNFPTLPEQQKIASFLSAVDEKIQQLSRKKELLEQYKKGVMQQLFSGKLRFKDENGKDYPDWEEKKLGEVAKFFKGKGISKNEISEDGIYECIRYGELYTRYGEIIQNVYSKTNFDINKAVVSQANDVIIPASGETQIDIATASCVMKSGVILGGDLNIIRTKNNGVFLSYYLNSARKLDIANLSQGISVVHLYSSQLALLNLSLPIIEEQQKIANFLSGIDGKIEQVNGELVKTQEYKKGLLQQLFV